MSIMKRVDCITVQPRGMYLCVCVCARVRMCTCVHARTCECGEGDTSFLRLRGSTKRDKNQHVAPALPPPPQRRIAFA